MGYSAILFYGYVGVVGLALFAALKWWFKAEVGLAQVWCTYGAFPRAAHALVRGPLCRHIVSRSSTPRSVLQASAGFWPAERGTARKNCRLKAGWGSLQGICFYGPMIATGILLSACKHWSSAEL